ncbi:uncharacterized protein LOC125679182 [Ostrea edulis]|uniref:uncharacterized protein LOC125679182 n=1 Tax=Ostrea edulis TaxID=37623 RepID=UPI0024AFC433|nr:uncharacterized protein LOC125679182 [Ostrea edulis]XP_048774129.2 uncharacterized protein LOC125679182 [Ostrea edulis]
MSTQKQGKWRGPHEGMPRRNEVEISDDDNTDQTKGVGTKRSKSQGSLMQTVQGKLMKFKIKLGVWSNPEGVERFLIHLVILGVLQAIMTGIAYALIQRSITDLKSCSRGSHNSDSSLPCSDCMCIATDGFSSTEFKNILTKLDTLSRDVRQTIHDQEVIGNTIKDMESRVDSFQSSVSEVTDLRGGVEGFKTELTSFKTDMLDNLRNSLDDEVRSIKSDIDTKIQNKVQEESTTLGQNLNEKIQATRKSSEEKIGVLKDHLEEEKTQRETDVQKMLETMKTVEASAVQNISDVKDRVVGMTGQIDYFYRELKEINIYIVGFLLLVVIGIIYGAYKVLLFRQTLPRVTDYPPTLNYNPPPTKKGSRSWAGGQSSEAIVERIARRSRGPGLSIVSFNVSSQQFHKSLVAGIPTSSSVNISAHLIRKLKDILEINPFSQVIIFVDFNERNIILEDPDVEIGDIRRMTTLGFQKMGCDVFVVYIRHRDSQTLQEGQLHSPRLYSIYKHPVLSELEKKKRVLSIYDKFHPHQVKFLEDCIEEL